MDEVIGRGLPGAPLFGGSHRRGDVGRDGDHPTPDDRDVLDTHTIVGAERVDEELVDVAGRDPHGAEPGRDRLGGQPLRQHRLQRGDVGLVAGVDGGEAADGGQSAADVTGQVGSGWFPPLRVVVGAEDEPGCGQLGDDGVGFAGQQVGDERRVDTAAGGQRRGQRLDRGLGAGEATFRRGQPVLEDRRLGGCPGRRVVHLQRRRQPPAGVVAEPGRREVATAPATVGLHGVDRPPPCDVGVVEVPEREAGLIPGAQHVRVRWAALQGHHGAGLISQPDQLDDACGHRPGHPRHPDRPGLGVLGEHPGRGDDELADDVVVTVDGHRGRRRRRGGARL